MPKKTAVASSVPEPENHAGVCPSCGHCPTCGRRNASPWYPSYPWQTSPPWTWPYYTYTIGDFPNTTGTFTAGAANVTYTPTFTLTTGQ